MPSVSGFDEVKTQQTQKEMTENEISYKIRGAAYDVYTELGPGLLESVYEEALYYELQQIGLKVERQLEIPIEYKGNKLSNALRLDLLVHRMKLRQMGE